MRVFDQVCPPEPLKGGTACDLPGWPGVQRISKYVSSSFRAPDGTQLVGRLIQGAPTHAILCKSVRGRWFLVRAFPSREAVEQEVAEKQELWRESKVVIVDSLRTLHVVIRKSEWISATSCLALAYRFTDRLTPTQPPVPARSEP
jgi:hypothetical protein